jgi:hypothetical protein
MDKATLAFFVCLLVLCGAFELAFATHQWRGDADGYGLSPEIAVAEQQDPSLN